MNLTQIRSLAVDLMQENGLITAGWRFEFDNARRRGGQCRHTHQAISLSRYLAPSWSDIEVRNTILHEIAHAVVGPGHGHDTVWRRKFLALGGDGAAKHRNPTVRARYIAYCDHCNVEAGGRHRLTKAMREGGLHAACRTRVRWVDMGVSHSVS